MCFQSFERQVRTNRLTLRAPRPDDAPRLAELLAEYDIAKMTSRTPHPYALSDAEGFIGYCAGADPDRDCNFLLEDETEGVIGGLGFFTPEDQPLEVGYWIGKPYWGRGYASEALNGALVWASDSWKKRFVTAGHFADNPASGAVLVKAGFLYTGDVVERPSAARGEKAPTRMMVWLA